MKLRRYIVLSIFFLISLVFVFSALAGFAGPHPNEVFNDIYGTAGTRLDNCLVCHFWGDPQFPENNYGFNVHEQLSECFNTAHGCDVTAIEKALRNIEPIDSDGDGYNNITEIYNLTFPGDTNDHPVSTINITVAKYDYLIDELTVKATSVYGADAALRVEGYGTMIWNRKNSLWHLRADEHSSPSRIIVCGQYDACVVK